MGKGGESSSSTASLRSGAAGGGASVKGSSGVAVVSSEVLIDGVWYDTSSFKHPGGRVLSYYAGRDATQVGPTVHLFGFWFLVFVSVVVSLLFLVSLFFILCIDFSRVFVLLTYGFHEWYNNKTNTHSRSHTHTLAHKRLFLPPSLHPPMFYACRRTTSFTSDRQRLRSS